MKKILALILFAFIYNLTFAQTEDSRKAAFHFSFISPVGTNGLQSAKTTNVASLNLLVGISKNEKAFTLGGFSNVILNNATGVQIAGLANYVGNKGLGFQVGGFTNINRGAFSGFQLAGLFNTAKDVKGVQVAGFFNAAKDAKGMQVAGLVNVAKNVNGVQIAGFVNTAKDVKGVQFSGLVNVAKDVKGVQVAGLVNIADNSDVPIGLINIIKNGEMGISITYDGIGNVMASFRSGGKYTYGIIGLGYNHKVKSYGLVSEAGFGARIPIAKWFRINNELKASSIKSSLKETIINTGYALLPAFRIGKHFEIFGGASINYMETTDMSARNIFPTQSLWSGNNPAKLEQVYIGYQVGMQVIF